LILVSLLGSVTATLNGDLATWYATRTLVEQLATMQPEVVAKLLSQVEQKWEEMAVVDLRSKTDAGASLASMKESCSKVTSAIVKGSDGDKDRIALYLEDVCKSASSESEPMCKNFASVLGNHLSHDVYSNREELDVGGFCADFYNGAVKDHAKKKAADLDAVDKAAAERAKAEAEARAKAEEEAAKTRAHAAADATKAEANRLAAEAVKELDHATDEITKVKETITQLEKRTDAIDKESKDAKDAADQARKEIEVATEKEAQAAEKEAVEAQEKVKALRLKKQEELRLEEEKHAAEARAKDEARKMVDAEKKVEAEKAVAETKEGVEKAAELKKAALIRKTEKTKATVAKTLRAGK